MKPFSIRYPDLSFLPLRQRKWIASLLHVLFLILALTGISTMYINDNLGVGITRIKNTPWEETDAFTNQFNQDLNNLFQYLRYKGEFSGTGAISTSQVMLQMTYGPNDSASYTLQDLITFLQGRGYHLSDSYQATKTESPRPGFTDGTGYTLWTIANPEIRYQGIRPSTPRNTLEANALQIMAVLHRYYDAYTRIVAAPSNFHYQIVYIDPDDPENKVTYTNDQALTPETARALGRYAYLPGNSIFYDTNIRRVALETLPAIAEQNPFDGTSFYLLAAVDTRYPVADLYASQHHLYTAMQNYYLGGFVLMVLGGLVTLATFLYLVRVSGHQEGRPDIVLWPIDRRHTETGLLFFLLTACAAMLFGRLFLIRLAHLMLPYASWELSERAIYYGIIYLMCLLTFFSMLRRWKAGVLWQHSFVREWRDKFAILAASRTFRSKMSAIFFAYLGCNGILFSLFWFVLTRDYLNRFAKAALICALLVFFLAFNIWHYLSALRHAAQMDRLTEGVNLMAAADSEYQVDTTGLSGQELALAEGLNHLGSGLQASLREQMRSEHLKADLITNVSHDIKTPLTSIINYVDLLRREDIDNPRIKAYLDVLDRKANRLKTLTEDLVEASKASSGNVSLEMIPLDLGEMACQACGEFEDRMHSRRLHLVLGKSPGRLPIMADGRSLWRVLENLYTNVCKYALDGSRVYVDLSREKTDDTDVPRAVFTIKNISSSQLNISPEELTERFVRGDVSRTTEGSGLGLSIAKNLTELMGGIFALGIDGDLFKATISFPIREEMPPQAQETDSTPSDPASE